VTVPTTRLVETLEMWHTLVLLAGFVASQRFPSGSSGSVATLSSAAWVLFAGGPVARWRIEDAPLLAIACAMNVDTSHQTYKLVSIFIAHTLKAHPRPTAPETRPPATSHIMSPSHCTRTTRFLLTCQVINAVVCARHSPARGAGSTRALAKSSDGSRLQMARLTCCHSAPPRPSSRAR